MGLVHADYSQAGELQGCKDLGVMQSTVAKAELDMIKPYFPINKNEDYFNIVKRFWMKYSNLGISESEFECVMDELKKNLALYYLDHAKANHQTQNTNEEIENLRNVLGWYPENYNAMYLLAQSYEKNQEFYPAYQRYEVIKDKSISTKLQEQSKERMEALKDKVEKEVDAKTMETLKKELGSQAIALEEMAKNIKAQGEKEQKEVKAKLEALLEQEIENEDFVNYLYLLIK